MRWPKARCPVCKHWTAVKKDGTFWQHGGGWPPCAGSGETALNADWQKTRTVEAPDGN